MTRTTQDDARENMQVAMFDLEATAGRSNRYIPDAYINIGNQQCPIELKTCDVARKQVSTARNVTLAKIAEWEGVWWVFSSYRKTEDGVQLVDHYLGNRAMLQDWFDKQKNKILNGTKTYAGLQSWHRAKDLLAEHMPPEELTRLSASFERRGVGLNDPKISWKYVEANCVKLDNKNLSVSLRKEISKILN